MTLRSLLRRMWSDRSGALLVEFAIAIPILLSVTLIGTDTARMILLQQKLDRAAVTLADLAAQAESLDMTDIGNLLTAVGRIADPYPLGPQSAIVLTSVRKPAGTSAIIDWQQVSGGLSAASEIGVGDGATATLPAGFSLLDGQTVIVAEVFYELEPLFLTEFGTQSIYRRAFYRPRYVEAVT
ncbi:MAG: pilus assembly protein, partial [Alphaproteobacteria bacterium]